MASFTSLGSSNTFVRIDGRFSLIGTINSPEELQLLALSYRSFLYLCPDTDTDCGCFGGGFPAIAASFGSRAVHIVVDTSTAAFYANGDDPTYEAHTSLYDRLEGALDSMERPIMIGCKSNMRASALFCAYEGRARRLDLQSVIRLNDKLGLSNWAGTSEKLTHFVKRALTSSSITAVRLFDKIADECILQIVDYLGPFDLASCEGVSRRFNATISSSGTSHMWLRFVDALWEETGFVFNVPRLCPLLERISKVPVSAMRRELMRYDTTCLTERADWMQLLRAKLIWGLSICTRSPRGWTAPQWARSINDCKAAFLFARIEVARKMPLDSELSRQKWDLIYNQQRHTIFDIEFFDNKEMTATSHGDMKFCWSLQGGPGSSGIEMGLQVDSFPMHKFTRESDGLWIISNAHVVMEQRSPPDDNMPLLEL